MRAILLIFLWGCLFVTSSSAQNTENPLFDKTIDGLFKLQQYYFPQEKAYLHFDRNHYVAGDTLWLRGYVVDAIEHRPDTQNLFLYVDLVDPADSVFLNAKIFRENNTFSGYLPIPNNARDGIYTLRAYTLFMRNSGEEYFFQTPVRISDPISVKIRAEVSFSPPVSGDNRLQTEIQFQERHNPNAVLSKEMKMGIGKAPLETYYADNNGIFSNIFKKNNGLGREVLRVDYEKSRRFIEIPPADDLFDVAFFPEGGYLIDKNLCTVGFKAINAYGLGEDVSGKLIDQDGNTFAEFKSEHRGIGYLSFIPEAGKKYYAECLNSHGYSRRFELPEVRNDAVALKTVHNNGKRIISVAKPQGIDGFKDLYLVIHTRGEMQYIVEFGDGSRPLRLPEEMLPSGISSILLMDSERNVLSERLIFCLNDDMAHVEFQTDKPRYAGREKVKASVLLTDENGTPVKGSFSVAVTDDKDILPDSVTNIVTNLLLTSDLKGYIEEPGWYFSGDPTAFPCLDYLMLTQGWTRYDIPEMMQGTLKQVDYTLAREISGKVRPLLSAKTSAGTRITAYSKELGVFMDSQTDEQGLFAIDNFPSRDSAHFLIQAFSAKGNDKVVLEINPAYIPEIKGIVPRSAHGKSTGLSDSIPIGDKDYAYIAKADQKWMMENGMRMIHLDALEVKARQSLVAPIGGSIYSIGPGFTDSIYDEKQLEEFISFEDLLGADNKVSLDMAKMEAANLDALIQNTIIIIDDMQADHITDLNLLEGEWPFQMIKRVEYLRYANPATLMFSMEGYPVLLITTKKNDPTFAAPSLSVGRVGVAGFQAPAEFYSPKYETAKQKNNSKADLRTTIYWNPAVTTDSDGKTSFEFYAADSNTTYSVVMEGVSEEGKIIRAVEQIIRE